MGNMCPEVLVNVVFMRTSGLFYYWEMVEFSPKNTVF